MSIQNTTGLSNLVAQYYDKKLLMNFYPNLVLYSMAQKRPIPKGSGTTINFHKIAKLSASTTPLVEGVAPAEDSLTATRPSATIKQYGNYILISDLLELVSIDPILDDAMKELGKQAALTVDTLCRIELDSDCDNLFAGDNSALTGVGTDDPLTAREILRGRVSMQVNDIMDEAILVAHPICVFDLKADTAAGGWMEVAKYLKKDEMILKGEEGKLFNVRIVSSSNIDSTASGTESAATVYSNLMCTKGCFGAVELDSKGVKSMIVPRKPSIADPLAQVNSVGWKIEGFAAKYLGTTSTERRALRVRAGTAFTNAY